MDRQMEELAKQMKGWIEMGVVADRTKTDDRRVGGGGRIATVNNKSSLSPRSRMKK